MTLIDALAECLEVLRQGGDVEACLNRYPRLESELRLLLEVALKIEPFPPMARAGGRRRRPLERLRHLMDRLRGLSEDESSRSSPRFPHYHLARAGAFGGGGFIKV